jgi:hypothetical protein
MASTLPKPAFLDLAQLEQVFRAVVLAAFADGEPSPDELAALRALLAQHPEYAGQRDARELVRDTYRLLCEHGPDALVDQIAAGLPDRGYRELAYTMVSRVVAADGKTATGEAILLGKLRERFGFTDADVLLLLSL